MNKSKPLAVLVIDDSVTIRKMIGSALRPLQASISEAGTGLDAIEKLAVHPYDLIFLDLNMPDMHGLEFLHFVRRHSAFRNIPIVVVTNHTDGNIRNQALEAGANQFINKPFTPEQLLSAAQELTANIDMRS